MTNQNNPPTSPPQGFSTRVKAKSGGVSPQEVIDQLPHSTYGAVIVTALQSRGKQTTYHFRGHGDLSAIDAVNLIAELSNMLLFNDSFDLRRSFTPDDIPQAMLYLRSLIGLHAVDHSTPIQ